MKSMAHMQKIQHIAVEEGASTARGFQEGKFSFSLTENDAKEERKTDGGQSVKQRRKTRLNDRRLPIHCMGKRRTTVVYPYNVD